MNNRPSKRQKCLDKVYVRLAATQTTLSGLVDETGRSRLDDKHSSILRALASTLEFLGGDLDGLKAEVDLGRAVPKAPERLSYSFPALKGSIAKVKGHLSSTRGDHWRQCSLGSLEGPLAKLQDAIVRLLEEQDEVTELQKFLGELMRRCQFNAYRLSEESGVSYRQVRRLLSGERRKTTRGTILSLGKAMANYTSLVTEKDVDRLIKLAGHPPLPRRT